jgi:hypothetical protein
VEGDWETEEEGRKAESKDKEDGTGGDENEEIADGKGPEDCGNGKEEQEETTDETDDEGRFGRIEPPKE